MIYTILNKKDVDNIPPKVIKVSQPSDSRIQFFFFKKTSINVRTYLNERKGWKNTRIPTANISFPSDRGGGLRKHNSLNSSLHYLAF